MTQPAPKAARAPRGALQEAMWEDSMAGFFPDIAPATQPYPNAVFHYIDQNPQAMEDTHAGYPPSDIGPTLVRTACWMVLGVVLLSWSMSRGATVNALLTYTPLKLEK